MFTARYELGLLDTAVSAQSLLKRPVYDYGFVLGRLCF